MSPISKSMAKRITIQRGGSPAIGEDLTVSQDQLSHLANLERRIAEKKAELALLATEYNESESPVMAALLSERKTFIEAGPYTVSVDWTVKRSPAYKQWIIKKHGEAVAKRILDATPESRTPYLVLAQTTKVVDEPVLVK